MISFRERLKQTAAEAKKAPPTTSSVLRSTTKDESGCVYGTVGARGNCPRTTSVECKRPNKHAIRVTLETCNSNCRYRTTEAQAQAAAAAVTPVPEPAPAPVQARFSPATDLPGILLLTTPRTHQDLYVKLAQHYNAAGGTINSVVWEPGAALWNVPALVKQYKPDVVLRWEEHGGLFTDRKWRAACRWMYERGIMPAMLDWGFFAHYKSLYVGYFREDGKPDIHDAWDSLPQIPDWSLASSELLIWRHKWLTEYAKADELGPVPGTEGLDFVLLWVQYSANGSRFPGWTGATWCQDAAKVIKDAGLVPVFKLPPKPGKMPVPQGEIQFEHRAKIPLLTHRLIRYARHSVAITTTATNGCVLVGAPVVSCGDQWCDGLGVWRDTKNPHDMCLTPEVNAKTRGKWANYWIRRQRPLSEVDEIVHNVYSLWQTRASQRSAASQSSNREKKVATGGTGATSGGTKRSIFMLGRGLGNMLMAVPAIKALSERTGTQVEVTGSKAHNRSFLELLKDERYVKSVSSGNAKDAHDAIIGGAALNYPAQIAQDKFAGQAEKIDIAATRLMTVHETEQDAQAARHLGFDGPLPSGRIHCGPPPRDLPPSYVAVCMECAPRWPQGKKRLWPHWEKFAKLWTGAPLVFVGKEPVSWAKDHGIDRIGDHKLPEVAAIIGGADVFVGIDCGLSHVAGAVGIPSLVLFGPTTSYHTGPFLGALTTLDGYHPCRACFGTPLWETCTKPRCMSRIRPEKVVEVLQRILWRRGRPLEAETAREQMRGRWHQANMADRHPSQWPQELDALWSQVAEIQAAHVMEIGVKRGGWMYVMAPTFRPGAHLIGVDIELQTVGRNGLKGALQTEGYKVDLIEGDSHTPETMEKVLAALDGAKLDILHVDGDHSLQSALADWHDYRPLVRSGGLVILHDAFKSKDVREPADVREAIGILKVQEGRRVVRWRWIHRMRANGSRGPGICIADIA